MGEAREGGLGGRVVGYSDESLVIQMDATPGTVVVCLAGELDLAGSHRLTEALARARGRPLLIDMSEIVFIDSSGIAALLTLKATATMFRVLRASEPVVRLLQLVGLHEEFCGPQPV